MQARSEIARTLTEEDNFLLACHEDPDGDAIGSMSALGHILKRLGKEFRLYCPGGLPQRFSWLKLPANILQSANDLRTNWLVALDCGSAHRLGSELQQNLQASRVINIDHHQGNPGFGELNWVDPQRSSVGEMVACLAQDLGLDLDWALGESLYLALVTDTGSFTYSNTKSSTLQIAAGILDRGLDLDRFNSNLYRQWNLAKVHAHGLAMQTAELKLQGRAGLITADKEVLRRSGAGAEDCEGLVNYMRQVRGVLVAVSLLEQENNIKFSLRSWGEVDVSAVASSLGGGGHQNAAGGKLALDLAQAKEQILQALEQALMTQQYLQTAAEGWN
ncbi:MAG: DHH family phosphoesterase [Thermodesulfobacteriota bacterium]